MKQFKEGQEMPRRAVNITISTIYKNVEDDDVQFNISPGAELILRGYDVFTDDAIAGGLTRVSGVALVIDDGLTIGDDAVFANASTVVQNSGTLVLDASATVRNLVGATYDLDDDAFINGFDASDNKFINNGLFLQTDGNSGVEVNFYDRGGTIQVDGAALDFGSAGNRFVDDTITGTGAFSAEGAFNNSNISAAGAALSGRFLGDVMVSSANVSVTNSTFAQGAILDLTNSAATVELTGVMGGEIDIRGDDNVSVSSSYEYQTGFLGYAILKNYGNSIFNGPGFNGTDFVTNPWTDDTVTIENEQGATWTDQGRSSLFLQNAGAGNSVFINYGTFIEDTANGANFDFSVINNGVMEGGSGLVAGSGKSSGLYFGAGLSGTGTVDVGAANVEVAGSVGSGQVFDFVPVASTSNLPTLNIADVLGFSALISGFDQSGAAGDQIELTAAWQFQGFTPNSGGTGGSLMFTNNGVDAAIDMSGSYDPNGFLSTTSLGKTIVTYSA